MGVWVPEDGGGGIGPTLKRKKTMGFMQICVLLITPGHPRLYFSDQYKADMSDYDTLRL